MKKIGIDFDENLFDEESRKNTPRRIRKTMEEFAKNRDWELSGARFKIHGYRDMVVLKDISFMSWCQHHMLPIVGKVYIAYIPNGEVLGLSKFVRIVEKFASRPQLQERMTMQIADYIVNAGYRNVMVVIEAEHYCMKVRGVKNGATVITSAVRGIYRDSQAVREEALMLFGFGGKG